MSKKVELEVSFRNTKNKGENKRLRNEGFIPGVVYGKSEKKEENVISQNIQVNERIFNKIFNNLESDSVLVNLSIDKKKSQLALMKGVQVNPLNDKILHIDFQLVKENEVIHTTIPLHLIGESKGVKNGGLLEHQIHSIDIHCQTKYLPDYLELDISELEIGDSLYVRDIIIPDNVHLNTNVDIIVALVTESRAMLAEETSGDVAEEGDQPKSPEVLTEKKPEEDKKED